MMDNMSEDGFDWVNRLALMADDKILSEISEKNIELLQKVVGLLGSCKEDHVVNETNFVATIRRMADVYRAGARLLGNTIIAADEWVKKGSLDKAAEEYLSFLSQSESKLYCEIAQCQLEKITRHND